MDTKPVSAPVSTRPMAKPKSRLNRATMLGLNTTPTPTAAPTSIVTPSASIPTAGRSPKSKRAGILSKRRTASPFFRIDPPTKSRGSGGLSIDAALGGTIAGYAPKSRVNSAPSRPTTSLEEQPTKGTWFFAIHEDTPDEELTNMMQHSTYTLDISDDEDRQRAKDDRGKENIPPEAPIVPSVDQEIAAVVEAPALPETVATPAPATKRRTHTQRGNLKDGKRAALADLAPSDFYEEAMLSSATFDFAPEIAKDSEVIVDAAEPIEELVAVTTSEEERLSPSAELRGLNNPVNEPKEIQIWESGSAQGDAE